jgi:peptide deformylase
MAILKIARMGHPVLRQAARPVEDPAAPQIRGLIRNMVETMQDANGAGLAAPQVHVPLRVVIFHVPEDRADEAADAAPQPLSVLINPEIELLTADTELGWEGCLSVPGLVGAVPRFTKIRYSGFAPDGSRIEQEAEGFHARVVQHECDHLDGILYPQRMTDLSLLLFQEELRHGVPEAMQGAEEPEAEAV